MNELIILIRTDGRKPADQCYRVAIAMGTLPGNQIILCISLSTTAGPAADPPDSGPQKWKHTDLQTPQTLRLW